MVTTLELAEQSHKIAELSKVLSHIIDDRALCDTGVTCDLFFDFVEQVHKHLETEDKFVYQALLAHKESGINNTADRFMSGSTEMKRVFKEYLKRWCSNKSLRIKNHDEFINETNEMFELVLKRIQDEAEHLYPTIREVQEQQALAA
jgi:hypoxanthine phosphoribosyltransferase